MALKQDQVEANRKLAFKLVWIIVGALLFAFALVPLYDVICSVTGLNGKTKNTAETATKAVVDLKREVTVQFVSSVMPGLGWNFYPKQNSVVVHPGQVTTVMFEAKNITNEEVVGQAIPSVTPGKASAHLKKIECFCFVRQSLKPGEVKALPLRFFVSAELPKDVQEMTLSYSFFPASQQ
ncbi:MULTISPECIES: cytochrome c oxidase assembly protein [unclassified Methylophilus]|jgi:cytochrome c oxidase assembly protein subunit 11|uniref:cytochrome c oxidase assembly protein n=1 Tax=unclassified Methylophilus TaxID=2630143 RepID=UPI00188F80BF|nr:MULTISPECIES: cytochrome c oxidase assembly protein [unclassified Methylophilus]MBF5040267.1 cytochrome c oxidase assembly protein [Methylophilus sp. 13]MDF0378246.1 cytochrome c oxidase assembly protein [Methylophilus sp. YYY-1]MDT7849705.1 cytochrome c oxidase assembly protein [Methylophilus sp. VKM B-3414]